MKQRAYHRRLFVQLEAFRFFEDVLENCNNVST